MRSARLKIEGMPYLREVIEPEMSPDILRSRSRIYEEGDGTVIYIEAEDTTALRAALTSSLRYVSAAVSAIDSLNVKKEE